jgi:hypothetical protein
MLKPSQGDTKLFKEADKNKAQNDKNKSSPGETRYLMVAQRSRLAVDASS